MIQKIVLILFCAVPLFANPASDKLVQQGDEAYKLRSDLAKAQSALTAYDDALRINPQDTAAC